MRRRKATLRGWQVWSSACPLSCRRIIRADKSQRNTLPRGDEVHRWGGPAGLGEARERSWKLESRGVQRRGRGEEGRRNRVPMPHYTDRLSFTHSRGSYFRVAGLRGWEPPSPERVPVAPPPSTVDTLRSSAPPMLLLFRVISTFRYVLRKRDFEAARDRSRAAQERLSITGFDFACSSQCRNYIWSQIFARPVPLPHFVCTFRSTCSSLIIHHSFIINHDISCAYVLLRK